MRLLLAILFAAVCTAQVRFIPASEVGAKRVLTPADGLIVHIGNGTVPGGAILFTNFEAVNVTDAPASVQVFFGSPEGDSMLLPLVGQDGQLAGQFAGIEATLPPGAGGSGLTFPTGFEVQVGYALVIADPPGSVAVVGIFNNQVPGLPLFQAGISPDMVAHRRVRTIFTGFDGGFISSLAVVSGFAQTLTVTAREQLTGQVLCSAPLFIPAAGHRAFIVRELLTCARNRQGIVEVTAPLGGIGAVGFLAADAGQGAFTTLQVFE